MPHYYHSHILHIELYLTDIFVYAHVCRWFDSEILALTVTKYRHPALATMITDSDDTMRQFQKAHNYLGTTRHAFLPLDVTLEAICHHYNEYDYMSQRSAPPVKECLGFAVDLMRIRECDEHLRLTAFALLFKNLVVFTTVVAMDSYTALLTPAEKAKFQGVALDQYDLGELKQLYPRFRHYPHRPCYYRNYPFSRNTSGGDKSGSTKQASTISEVVSNIIQSSPSSPYRSIGGGGLLPSCNTPPKVIEKESSRTYMDLVIGDLQRRQEAALHSLAVIRYTYY